ncbi:MAG: hypothetical protein ACI9QN_002395 [Arcticibacterium sp.]
MNLFQVSRLDKLSSRTTLLLKSKVFCALIFIGFSACSQVSTVIHQVDYDAKLVRFGYFMGISQSSFRIKHSSQFLDQSGTDLIDAITSPQKLGLKLGGSMNFNRGDHFDVRLMPTVAIYSRQILVDQDPDKIPSRDQAWFELPIMLKYKSLRRGNMRMNVFIGIRPAFETNAVNLAKKASLTRNARLKTLDFSVDYGAGLELFRRYFKLSPELHFSHGLSNAIKPGTAGAPSNPIDILNRLNSHTVSFILAFE